MKSSFAASEVSWMAGQHLLIGLFFLMLQEDQSYNDFFSITVINTPKINHLGMKRYMEAYGS